MIAGSLADDPACRWWCNNEDRYPERIGDLEVIEDIVVLDFRIEGIFPVAARDLP